MGSRLPTTSSAGPLTVMSVANPPKLSVDVQEALEYGPKAGPRLTSWSHERHQEAATSVAVNNRLCFDLIDF